MELLGFWFCPGRRVGVNAGAQNTVAGEHVAVPCLASGDGAAQSPATPSGAKTDDSKTGDATGCRIGAAQAIKKQAVADGTAESARCQSA